MKHVSNALSRSLPVLKPLPFCQRLKSIAKHFTFGRQEDAHECLRYVIDHMCRSCLSIHENELGAASKFDHLTKSTTAINQIFGGYHRSQVLCLNCKEKSNTYDYFMDFMLDIQVRVLCSHLTQYRSVSNSAIFTYLRMSQACKMLWQSLSPLRRWAMITRTSARNARNQSLLGNSSLFTENPTWPPSSSSDLIALECLARFQSRFLILKSSICGHTCRKRFVDDLFNKKK